MKIYSIYKATNVLNGKCYIGFDSAWPNRMNEHIKFKGSYINNAISKYGSERFTWEVICQSLDGQYLLKQMEPYFIIQYDSMYPNGYNMTNGGDGMVVVPEIIRRKMSRKRRLRITKESTIEKLKINAINNINKFNETTKEWKTRITWKITYPSGEVVEVNNLREFCRNHKLTQNLMLEVAYGNQNHHKQFKCERISTNSKYDGNFQINVMKHQIPRWELCLPNGELIQVYDLKLYSKENNLGYDNMKGIYYGTQKSHKGYTKVRKLTN